MKRWLTTAMLMTLGLLAGSEIVVRLFFARNMSGRFEYGYNPTAGFVEHADGTVSLVFGGSYAVTSSPTSAEQGPESVPHDGTFQLTLRFWQDGTTLFQSSIALIES